MADNTDADPVGRLEQPLKTVSGKERANRLSSSTRLEVLTSQARAPLRLVETAILSNVPSVTRILFVCADPTDAARLRLGEEIREIRERLQLSKFSGEYALVERHCVRPADLTQAIFDTDPHVVHFSGHGASTGSICFENKEGKGYLVPPAALESLFALFSDRVFCVILNACHSKGQAEAIARKIRYVVGMRTSIGDAAAISFSTGFYRALGNRKNVADAFQFGLVEMQFTGTNEHSTPILLTNAQMRRRLVTARQRKDRTGESSYDVTTPSMPGRATIRIHGRRGPSDLCALVDPDSYSNMGELLDELFSEHLVGIFPPYSYGSTWILRGDLLQRNRVVAPLIWATAGRRPISEIAPNWSETMPADEGVAPGSYWAVSVLRGDEDFYGIATNRADIFDMLCGLPKEIARNLDEFDIITPGEFEESAYDYRGVFDDWLSLGLSKQILVDRKRHSPTRS